MMKPISTFGQTALRNAQLRRLEGEIATATNELATGKKEDVAKTIGSELINLQGVRNQFTENNAYLRSISIFKQRSDLMDGALAEAEAAVEDLTKVAALNAAEPLDSAGSVKLVAESLLDRIVTALNVQVGGRYLFGGARVDQQALQPIEKNGAGGVTPLDIANNITTGTTGVAGFAATDLTTVTTVAEADELLQRFEDVFYGTNAASADPAAQAYSFENTIYNGEIDGSLLEIRLPNNTIETQLNDELINGLRDVFQGAYILASVDLESIDDDDAYRQLMTGDDFGRQGALDRITSGLAAIQRSRADLGLRFNVVDAAEEAVRAQNALLNNQIVALEGVDRAEVTTRLLDIENQLEASYAVTGRVLQLRLFNYVR
ncbi:hypothetical protein HK107_13880 [Parvularcula sp. ZS-1/3]|uniref:Flagellin C-terminal domain-containing protein n=1 Tax=Parvularcula mediterranea TaxID=2732508 RepID=A0A7Y3RNM8_9PROT|nr:flagellin [Parvularcula mediterranea]NNU17417.1 hypothetical protein [Parvularcula mediterranea]